MNIIVRTHNGSTIARPDTTYKREDGASFLPEFVSKVTASPVLFARICKAGRSIQEKFAARYVSSFGAGVLLYPENLIEENPEGYARACCLDHTTFLSTKEYSRDCFDKENLDVLKDGSALFFGIHPSSDTVLKAVCDSSRSCYLRTGDIVCLEVRKRCGLLSRPGEKCLVEIRSQKESLHSFDVIL